LASETQVPQSLKMTGGLAMLLLMLAVTGEWFLAAVYGEAEVRCDEASVPVALPELHEASGIAASRRTPGLLWAINDSGEPMIYGVNEVGETKARVRVTGASLTDWEDLSVAPCATGDCLYIADIGDNDERRSSIHLYRVAEPAPQDKSTAAAEVFEARYPDRPHDAEAVFVTNDGGVYILTKETLAGGLYRFPALESGKLLTLEHVAMVPASKITDADASADGQWVAVRTGDEVVFYRTAALLNHDIEHGAVVLLTKFDEPQGEGVTFGSKGTVFLAGEGGGKRAPGTLVQLRCAIPSAS
jgi:hypothetical protein